MPRARGLLRSILKDLNIGLTRYETLELLRMNARTMDDIELFKSLPEEHAFQLISHLTSSRSQLRQDLFVLSQLNFKRNGYFVEFGATNGVDLSNTYLLETQFGWTGILAEPGKCWHDALTKNRRAHIETECVWKDSRSTIPFDETDMAELSTIAKFSDSDGHQKARKHRRTYSVGTISLNDLLEKYRAPQQIDYLSIDTEGSEYEILSSFDFDKYSVQVITCEHNFTPMREKIFDLLIHNNYERVLENHSKFDDWYVRSH